MKTLVLLENEQQWKALGPYRDEPGAGEITYLAATPFPIAALTENNIPFVVPESYVNSAEYDRAALESDASGDADGRRDGGQEGQGHVRLVAVNRLRGRLDILSHGGGKDMRREGCPRADTDHRSLLMTR